MEKCSLIFAFNVIAAIAYVNVIVSGFSYHLICIIKYTLFNTTLQR